MNKYEIHYPQFSRNCWYETEAVEAKNHEEAVSKYIEIMKSSNREEHLNDVVLFVHGRAGEYGTANSIIRFHVSLKPPVPVKPEISYEHVKLSDNEMAK